MLHGTNFTNSPFIPGQILYSERRHPTYQENHPYHSTQKIGIPESDCFMSPISGLRVSTVLILGPAPIILSLSIFCHTETPPPHKYFVTDVCLGGQLPAVEMTKCLMPLRLGGASIRQFSLIWWRFQADSTTGVQLSHEASSTHATNFNYLPDIYQLLDHIWRVMKLQQDSFQKFVSDLCQAVTRGWGASEFMGLTWGGAERWSGNKHHCTFEQFSPDLCLIDWSWWLIFDADDLCLIDWLVLMRVNTYEVGEDETRWRVS